MMNELPKTNPHEDMVEQELDETLLDDSGFKTEVDLQSEDTAEVDECLEEDLLEVDLSDFSSAKSTNSNKTVGEAGLITIVNSRKNGKRITLSHEVLNHLNNPDEVEIAFKDNEFAIAEQLPGNGNKFTVKKSGSKGIVYSTALVLEMTQKFGLDFSNRVSRTFNQGRFGKYDDFPVVIIQINE